MTKIFTVSALLFMGAFFSSAQDLQVSNIQYSYDFQTAVLDVSFDMENTGTFSTFDGVVCEVSIMDLGTTEYVVGSVISDDFGLNGGDYESLGVSNMDLDNVQGLATGDYYVKVCVDVTNIEMEDNESNNCGQNTSSFSFESLVTSVGTIEPLGINVLLHPNPVTSNQLTFSFSEALNHTSNLVITDASGRVVLTHKVLGTDQEIDLNISDLEAGIYYYVLSTNEHALSGKFVRN
ncbi:MAG: T9SS type A sorting domain-containing protein [Crocinitomicaceae bacterium]